MRRTEVHELEAKWRSVVRTDLERLSERAQPPLRKPIQRAVSGGRRLRACLTLAVASDLGLSVRREKKARAAAAAIELLHAATLVQDDLFDQSNMRRGRPTLHVESGKQTAILVSDWLLTEALRQAYSIHRDMGDATAACAQAMIAGEVAEPLPVQAATVAELSAHVTNVMRAKTGALLGLALSAPVLLSGRLKHRKAEALNAAGIALGVAFQYIDDALDLYGDPLELGKDVLHDLTLQVCTLPVLEGFDCLQKSQTQPWMRALGRKAVGAPMAGEIVAALSAPCVRRTLVQSATRRWKAAVDAVGTAMGEEGSATVQYLRDLCPVLSSRFGELKLREERELHMDIEPVTSNSLASDAVGSFVN